MAQHPLESLPLKKCFYWGDRYLEDIEESGLFFDLRTVRPQDAVGGDTGLNTLIDATNKLVQGVHVINKKNRLCCLGALESQLLAMGETNRNLYAGKTVLMYFKPGFNAIAGEQLRDFPLAKTWKQNGLDMFVWSSPMKVYTWIDANGMAFRFRSAPKSEVDEYLASLPVPQPPIPIYVPPDPTDPPGSTDPPSGGIPGGGIPSIPSEINVNVHIYHHDVEG